MKLWVDPLAPEVRRAIPTKCCSLEHIERAKAVCSQLDIPFYVLNLEDEFKKDVVDPFIQDYKDGKTPNPCIECNRNIKFGTLLSKMKELGCEKLATGHYAQVQQQDGIYQLKEAEDQTKDQSYYLYGLSQEQLSCIMFPLGAMEKSETFALAKEFEVPMNSSYRESQDLCFYPEKDPQAFLERYIPDTKEGTIRLEDETEVGTHKGLPFYTIGQRKGLGIGGLKIPLHVTRKDTETNTIYVAPDGSDCKLELRANNVHWIHTPLEKNTEIQKEVRISSLGKRYKTTINYDGNTLFCTFNKGLRGISDGQSVVIYDGNTILGGATICTE